MARKLANGLIVLLLTSNVAYGLPAPGRDLGLPTHSRALERNGVDRSNLTGLVQRSPADNPGNHQPPHGPQAPQLFASASALQILTLRMTGQTMVHDMWHPAGNRELDIDQADLQRTGWTEQDFSNTNMDLGEYSFLNGLWRTGDLNDRNPMGGRIVNQAVDLREVGAAHKFCVSRNDPGQPGGLPVSSLDTHVCLAVLMLRSAFTLTFTAPARLSSVSWLSYTMRS